MGQSFTRSLDLQRRIASSKVFELHEISTRGLRRSVVLMMAHEGTNVMVR